MFESLRDFLQGLTRSGAPRQFEENDHRLAATALLIHVADADGELDDEEAARLREIVSSRFHLDAGDAARLVREALESDREAVGIDQFVTVLKRVLDGNGRLKIVEMMWDIVYADGDASETEDSIMWRIAGMLGVSERELETLRQTRAPGDWPEPQA